MAYQDPRSVLQEIGDNIRRATTWVATLSAAELAADEKTFFAVVRCLEIVSEASRRLPDEIKNRNPEIPWRNIADAGNVYRHVYHDLHPQLIWSTVTHALPPLAAVIEVELGRNAAASGDTPS